MGVLEPPLCGRPAKRAHTLFQPSTDTAVGEKPAVGTGTGTLLAHVACAPGVTHGSGRLRIPAPRQEVPAEAGESLKGSAPRAYSPGARTGRTPERAATQPPRFPPAAREGGPLHRACEQGRGSARPADHPSPSWHRGPGGPVTLALPCPGDDAGDREPEKEPGADAAADAGRPGAKLAGGPGAAEAGGRGGGRP